MLQDLCGSSFASFREEGVLRDEACFYKGRHDVFGVAAMSTKQLLLMVTVTAALALTLAWVIERTQIRNFMVEFDEWWEVKQDGKQRRKPTDG